jgi:hypothetical protein
MTGPARTRARSRLAPAIALLVIPAIVIAAVVVLPRAATSAAGTPGWHAGDAVFRSVPAAPADASGALGRAIGIAKRLGVAAIGGDVRRLHDDQTGRTFDEAALRSLDGVGATLRLDPDTGLPTWFIRDGQPAGWDRQAVDAAHAGGRARAYAAVFGLAAGAAAPSIRWMDETQCWEATWSRTLDGYPVPADGTRVCLFPGGQLQSASVVASPNRPAPSATIGARRAQDLVEAYAADRGLAGLPGFRILPPTLEWDRPNSFLDGTQPDAIDRPLQLVYRVAIEYRAYPDDPGPTTLVLLVDAGDGTLVGGTESA